MSENAFFICQAISSHLIPWPTGCKWHFFLPGTISSCLIPWPTPHLSNIQQMVSLTGFPIKQSHFSSYVQQTVSYIPFFLTRQCSLLAIPWQKESEWDCTCFYYKTIWPYTIPCMTNRQWVMIHISYVLYFLSPHFTPWLTGSEWSCTFYSKQSAKSHLITHRESVMHLSECITKSNISVWQDVSTCAFFPAKQGHSNFIWMWQIESELHCALVVQHHILCQWQMVSYGATPDTSS